MAKTARGGDAPVQGLLDERRRIETWLARLAVKRDEPEHVRARIREDYEKRLAQTIHELRQHMQTLRDGLNEREDRRRRLGEDASQLEDRLSDARVRHDVGEYDEEKWNRINESGEEELGAVRARLAGVQEEIEGLREVVRLIEASEQPAPEPTPAPPESAAPAPAAAAAPVDPAPQAAGPPTPKLSAPVAPTLDPVSPALAEPVPPPPSVDPARASKDASPPAPNTNATGAQTEVFDDEIAFIRASGPEAGEPPRRASGAHRRPTLVRDEETKPAPKAASPFRRPSAGHLVRDEETKPAPKAASPFRRPSAGQAEKTLTCADCGTMNLPTEWYCEQCGAELAAL